MGRGNTPTDRGGVPRGNGDAGPKRQKICRTRGPGVGRGSVCIVYGKWRVTEDERIFMKFRGKTR